MMATGGTSSKRIPQFSDAAASFDCAAATVLHMAHPWASSSGALTSAVAKATAARMTPFFVAHVFHRCQKGCQALISE